MRDGNEHGGGREVKMKDLKQILAAAIALCVLSASAMAFEPQKNEQKPPPKGENKVEKREKPPPPPRENNSNRGGNNDNKRGKP
jgi:hypothetical protein